MRWRMMALRIWDLIIGKHATALHYAAGEQDAATVAILLAHGAAVNVLDADGCTPLDWAEMAPSERVSPEIGGLLEAYGAKRGERTMERFTSGEIDPTEHNMRYAVEKGHIPSVLALLRRQPELGPDALVHAVSVRRLRMVRAILSSGIELARESLTTALHCSAYHGHTVMVRDLLDAGADPNVLYAPAFRGKLTVVRQLLAAGANPNPDPPSPALFWNTLLEASVKPVDCEWHGHPSIVRELVTAGTHFTERTGSTLEEAMRRSVQDVEPYTFLHPDELNARDDDGVTLLMRASELGCTGTVRTLLRRGADPDLIDPHGRNALDRAAAAGHTEIVELLQIALRERRGQAGRDDMRI